jgi:hypothetical protein
MPVTNFILKNTADVQKVWGGQEIDSSGQYFIQEVDNALLLTDEVFRLDLASGVAVLTDGTRVFTESVALTALSVDERTYFLLAGGLDRTDSSSLDNFLNARAVVTDPLTGIHGPYHIMETLSHRRELFNDTTNPVYHSSVTPILGVNGYLQDHANRLATTENIHSKLGWHNQEVQQGKWNRPKDMLIYYGWLSGFNYDVNAWNLEKVSQDIAKYRLVLLGSGLQDPSHGDYTNTQTVITRLKILNPNIQTFGYVAADATFSDFTGKVDQWGQLGVHGIFMDQAGYDYGLTRSEFNQRVDYVHDRTSTNSCFVNSWNTNHVLGTENDPSYPNSTYNDTSAESNLETTDWVLLESYPINTVSYGDGYESRSDWATRGVTMNTLRSKYAVNFASANIIANDRTDGTALCSFAFLSSMMWSLDGFGTSDTNYGSSSSIVKYWPRPQVHLGGMWSINPGVQVDVNDSSVFHRYVEDGRLSLKFTEGDKTGTLSQWYGISGGLQGATGVQGATGIQGQGTTGLIGATGLQGLTGLTVSTSFGSLYTADSTNTMSISSTPTRLTLLNTAGVYSGVTLNTVNSTMVNSVAGNYQVDFNISCQVGTAGTGQFHLRDGTTELLPFAARARLLTTPGNVGFSNVGYFAKDSTLSIYVEGGTTTTLSIFDAQLFIRQII